jgi:hypothetical protein
VVAFESAGDGDWDRATYPGSLMGAIALVRQTFLDARWHAECERAWAANPGTGQPPVTSDALRALHAAAAGEATAWLDATDDRAALRAAGLARELGLRAVIVGSGREYRRAAELRAAGVPVVVPMEFPQAPDLSVPRGVDAMPLRELAHWAMAPANLAELVRAGVPAAASTVRMKDRPGFRRALQRASDAGTTDDELLAALTVNAARAAGVERTCGTLRPGMLANVAVFTGAPFDPDSELRATWVAGVRHDVAPRSPFPARGTFTLGAAEGPVPEGFRAPATVTVDPDRREVGFVVPAQAPDAKPQQARGQGAAFDAARATFVIDGDALGAKGPLRGTVEAAPGGFTVALASATGAPVVRWSVPAAARTGDVPPRGTDLLGDASGGKLERPPRADPLDAAVAHEHDAVREPLAGLGDDRDVHDRVATHVRRAHARRRRILGECERRERGRGRHECRQGQCGAPSVHGRVAGVAHAVISHAIGFRCAERACVGAEISRRGHAAGRRWRPAASRGTRRCRSRSPA